MNIEELAEQIINENLNLLKVSKVLDTNEAYSRGSAMLTAQAKLTNCWKEIADKLILAKANEEQAWHIALTSAEGKSVGEREAAAKASLAYQEVSNEVERLKNNLTYIQSFARQFDAGFRLFSYMIKGDVQL
jgi:hypothetical protein